MSGSTLNQFLRTLKKPDLIVTPRYDAWLIANPDFPALTEQDKGLFDRALGPRGSRAGVFTGSQAMECYRLQMFQFIGVDPLRRVDPVLQLRYFDGTFRHIRWQISLTHAIPGFDPEFRVDSPLFRGSLDGIHIDERWGLELKGTAWLGKNITGEIIEHHLHQATRYWLATDHMLERQLTAWVFIYENKQNQEHKEIVVKRSADVEHRVQKELDLLTQYVNDRELPPVLPDCVRGRGPVFNGCPYSHMCLQSESWDDAVRLTPTRNRRETQATQATSTNPNGRAKTSRTVGRRKPESYRSDGSWVGGQKPQRPGVRGKRVLGHTDREN